MPLMAIFAAPLDVAVVAIVVDVDVRTARFFVMPNFSRGARAQGQDEHSQQAGLHAGA
jgi:hypothetical protein